MTATEAGLGVLARMADDDTNRTARKLVADGEGEWIWDPMVPNVVGLVRPNSNRAWLVVYLASGSGHEDFEVSTDMEDRMLEARA